MTASNCVALATAAAACCLNFNSELISTPKTFSTSVQLSSVPYFVLCTESRWADMQHLTLLVIEGHHPCARPCC